ncbi:hypothetical protein GCM10025331_67070 [Actinoplanes utahensis]|nr:hypothetical protein Aut01nite_53310 [Actinoplanes utahensis]
MSGGVPPALVVLLVAPFFGEVLSTATPPLDLILPWRFPVVVALYGCGALLCREIAHRFKLGLPGLCLLAAAYAVYEEGLVDRFWFDPRYWADVGVGSYSEVWHTNLLIASHLTVFHVAVSVCSSVLVVEWLFPAHRNQPWTGRRGRTLAGLALLGVLPLTYTDFARVPAGQMLAAGGLCLLLIAAAFLIPRRRRPPRAVIREPRRRLVGLIAFAGTAAHFVLVYTVPSTGLAWPAGMVVTLAPVAAAALLINRLAAGDGAYGPDGLWAVTGIVAFFLMLDALVGLGGRYDLTAGALATTLAFWSLHRSLHRRKVPSHACR